MKERDIEVLAETEEFSIWRIEEPDGEITYHLELGTVTAHFFEEELKQFMTLMDQLRAS